MPPLPPPLPEEDNAALDLRSMVAPSKSRSDADGARNISLSLSFFYRGFGGLLLFSSGEFYPNSLRDYENNIARARFLVEEKREREKDLGWFFRCARWLLVKAMNGCVEYIFARARERESPLSLSLTRARANSLLLLFCLACVFVFFFF